MLMTDIEGLLRQQWKVLRTWLEDEHVLDQADEASGVGDWTIGELVVHLGFGLRMVAELTPATDRDPIAVARYVAGYAAAHQQIAADTSDVAASLRGRELDGIDELAGEAWAALDRGLPEVVLGRRGPLRRDDFLLTRLLEVVTHGDDLHRRLRPGRPSPVLTEAGATVAAVLAEGYEQAAGHPPGWVGIDLIRVATGRKPTEDTVMPLLS
jgi:hypothetical protein